MAHVAVNVWFGPWPTVNVLKLPKKRDILILNDLDEPDSNISDPENSTALNNVYLKKKKNCTLRPHLYFLEKGNGWQVADGKEVGVRSVSYTHLDVYKRQVMISSIK